ncbi:hypothetical protein SAMN05216370_0883 [Pseudomonas peli]|uniref:PI3K/PI4K catalytic domain-containing protein n=1 Tax=Pseudomonas peli TaxID=592361 RepID=A0AB37Z3U2_9PSED|nr:hypothetical protein [Pseudomonas peli]NMZ68852.1 hypothetical protein [Pseudomonas peli]SCW38956.1 hypothetical protein SAMN05216370_0883 [Pseudomonas peli]
MSQSKHLGKATKNTQAASQAIGSQKRLFPVDILTEYPNNQGSADLQLIINGRDGRDYAVKKPSDGNGKIPASEFFCYELAYRVTIPTPNWAYINLTDGDLGFGSAWEGGVKSFSPALVLQILHNKIKVSNLKVFLSRLYAFDLFVNNVDRHWGNYIWREGYDQNLIALAFDFSRACFEVGHTGYDALRPGCNTQESFKLINLTLNYDRSEALRCLDIIASITASEIEDMISEIPTTWMTDKDKTSYIDWWGSQARLDRIVMIKGNI